MALHKGVAMPQMSLDAQDGEAIGARRVKDVLRSHAPEGLGIVQLANARHHGADRQNLRPVGQAHNADRLARSSTSQRLRDLDDSTLGEHIHLCAIRKLLQEQRVAARPKGQCR